MRRAVAFACMSLVWSIGAAPDSAAQDLVITNARIIDGNGGTIDNGSVVVEDGRIVSVSEGTATPEGGDRIDARGRTVLPGFIDTHRHVMGGGNSADGVSRWLEEEAPPRMRDYLSAGFTTIMSAGDTLSGIIELRRRLAEGEIEGPRLLVSGDRIHPPSSDEQYASCQADDFCRENNSLVRTPEEARAKVRELAAAGVDMVKVRLDRITEPQNMDVETLRAIADESNSLGIPTVVHATNVADMMTSVEVGTGRLVHTPHTGVVEGTDGASIIRSADVPMSSTLGVYVPRFDNEENEPRFRNNGPYPEAGPARAGQGPVNARYLWDQGVTMAFGTDTGFLPVDSLKHELRPLSLLFSSIDIITMLTKNAADFLDLGEEIGTLEAGKLADIVILDSDPLDLIQNVLDVAVVIKSGRVVIDNR